MQTFFCKLLATMLVAVSLFTTTAHADDGMANMKLFKGGMQHGKWRMELLESSDASMKQMMDKMGTMSMCMDLAMQMAKENPHSSDNSCTHKVIHDSATSAEVEVTCDSGSHIHSLINRDGDKSYTADVNITRKDGKPRTMKIRYSYEGECQGDAVMQMDKGSEMCKKMREKTNGMDLTAMCARLPEGSRAQCEEHMKQVQASCQ